MRICVQIVECAGMPHQNSTVVEALICSDDCVTESKDKERRAGWLCPCRGMRRAEGLQRRRQSRPREVGRAL
jgi:hypothetical protein